MNRAERVMDAVEYGNPAVPATEIVVEALRAMAELGGSWGVDDLRALADEVKVVALPPMSRPGEHRQDGVPGSHDMTAQVAYDILRAVIDAQREDLRAYEALDVLRTENEGLRAELIKARSNIRWARRFLQASAAAEDATLGDLENWRPTGIDTSSPAAVPVAPAPGFGAVWEALRDHADKGATT